MQLLRVSVCACMYGSCGPRIRIYLQCTARPGRVGYAAHVSIQKEGGVEDRIEHVQTEFEKKTLVTDRVLILNRL